jgi:transposase
MEVTNDDLAVLCEWSAAQDRISLRAKMVLLARESRSPIEIAKHVGTNARAVRKWLERYQRLGLAGLVEEKRSGRPVTDKKLSAIEKFLIRAINRESKESVEQFAQRINRSPDVVWRSARLLGIKPTRKVVCAVDLDVDAELAQSGLLGLFLSQGLVVAALREGPSLLPDDHLFDGLWLSPSSQVLKAAQEAMVKLKLNNAFLGSPAISTTLCRPRAINEIWRRWLAGIIRSEPRVARSLLFLVSGNMTDPRALEILRLRHDFMTSNRTRLKEGDTVPPVNARLYSSRARWIEDISGQLDPFLDGPFREWVLPWCSDSVSTGFFAWHREPRSS